MSNKLGERYTVTRNGRYSFEADGRRDGVTVILQGELGTAEVAAFREIGGVVCPVYDGGPIKADTLDNFGRPAREIVIAGAFDALIMEISKADDATDFDMVAA